MPLGYRLIHSIGDVAVGLMTCRSGAQFRDIKCLGEIHLEEGAFAISEWDCILRALFGLGQVAGCNLLYGLFSQSILTRDVQALENLYHTNGFLQAKVTPEVQDNYGKKGHIRVILNVNEGVQTVVGKLLA